MTIEYLYPGVYIEEITGPGVIAGVGTSTAAFLGPAARGPIMKPLVITSFDEFIRKYGDSNNWPFLDSAGRRYFLGHGVQGFFENGGTQAVIMRVGSGAPTTWTVNDLATGGSVEELFKLQTLVEGLATKDYVVTITETPVPATAVSMASPATANVTAVDPNDRRRATINQNPSQFVPGDFVLVGAVKMTVVTVATSANGPVLVLDADVTGTPTVKIAPITTDQLQFRLDKASPSIQAGSLIQTSGGTKYFAMVDRTDAAGFVYLRSSFQGANGNPLAAGAKIDPATTAVQSLDFTITIVDGAGKNLDDVPGLSLDPFHTGYLFAKTFNSVRALPPAAPPTTTRLSYLRPATPIRTIDGQDDDPSKISSTNYQQALTKLEDVDDVNIVCAPDAANDVNSQKELVNHCKRMKDRIAVLDVPRGFDPANPPSALEHEQQVSVSGGYAALYYPWLQIPDPVKPGDSRPLVPVSRAVPPSGYIAGVYARVDQALGVHTPPANTEVLGVVALERRLSDREQGLINNKGVNAIRIFPGDGRVLVWGARTTSPVGETDWTYVNVRRLMFYIEESIQKGIRWAVFKPNDYGLWQSLKRTIGSFLERVWKDGGLVGLKREDAYQVRIDEGLNPPEEMALGRLHIEIKVAPVRPAEFIIVRIGLWDGGAQVTES